MDVNVVMGSGATVTTALIRGANATGLSTISQQIAKFEDDLYSGDDAKVSSLLGDASRTALGTFSIHNLGMYGVKSAAPIILTPQACALSLGAIVDAVVPAKADGKSSGKAWQVSPVMTATLSCDHRVVDGAVGAQWLSVFKELVENPMTMLL